MKIYIIIVTYNGMAWIEKCLTSCGEYPVIIVDNGSLDGTTVFIETKYPNVTLLKQKKNLGFGQANNIGIAYALQQGAEYVFLLNQDAYIVKDALDSLLSFQIQNPDYGILSPLHLKNDTNTLDERFENYLRGRSSVSFSNDSIVIDKLDNVYDMSFVNAAAWLISKKCIEIVGGFDPIFFHYGEDDNYCQRVLFHDFKIGVLSSSKVIHDRIFIEDNKVIPYSSEYYALCERDYKVKYANVNKNSSRLKKQLKKLRNRTIKALLKFILTESYFLFKEFLILKRIEKPILNSLNSNKSKGLNHLKFS